MALTAAQILALIQNAGGVLKAVSTIADEFNQLFGSVEDVHNKVRWLEISIVNLSTEQTLYIDKSWFDSGRFWAQPFDGIAPGSAQTFFVCNSDGSIFTGVSGGVSYKVVKSSSQSKFTEGSKERLICTFSNPYAGATKCLTRWMKNDISSLFGEMEESAIVRDERCGCYRAGNNKVVFIWKDKSSHW
ncbi:hypothetical protein O6H91_20G050100 [Diphasiastrum complanatum]|uniref:Uncharacterized protein n=2 Tax=Diphasiastrum complanatum TaxID=34168 RepID=A0ACC2APZ1_DIPCM|nr:hypothetical protein O6H91_Y432600 [Diphasiastrum complanatum]KAJ7519673.1 hypothetical protein O6H91_20G050100 [Diphasiastrum complanatum]